MIFNRKEYGDQKVKFALLPAPLHDFHDGYGRNGWVWLQYYTIEYRGSYWGWRNRL